MHQDISTVYALSRELSAMLQGRTLRDSYTLSREEVILVFCGEDQVLTIRLLTKWRHGYLFFSHQGPLKGSNAQPVFEELAGKAVTGIEQHKGNRSFALLFPGEDQLVFKMYDGLANIILFRHGKVTDMFRESIASDWDLVPESFQRVAEPVTAASRFLIVSEKGANAFYADPGNEVRGEVILKSGNVLEALTEFSRLQSAAATFAEKKQELLKELRRKEKHLMLLIDKNRNALRSIEEEVSAEEIGHLLMAQMDKVQPGDTTVDLWDFYREQPITIALKKDLNPQQNAAYYYRKSRNRRIEKAQLEEKINRAEKQIGETRSIIEKVSLASELKSLRPYFKERKAVDEKPPFRIFEKNGFVIWVGKNAANNDLLTMKYARKNDLWLHARDVPGSHVVIRAHAGKTFPADIIRFAAGIAAYYSKLKGSKWVPVSYTPKKYVRKSKHMEPGEVFLEREEMIMVEPSLE